MKQNHINLPFTGEGVDASCVMAALRRRVMDAARNVTPGPKVSQAGKAKHLASEGLKGAEGR